MNKYGELINPTTLRFERLLPGPIERVWEYLTNGEKRGKWFAGGGTGLEPGEDIKFVFHNNQLSDPVESPPERYNDFGDGFVSHARVVKFEQPHLFVIEWEGLVTFELSPVGDQVKLVLIHEKLQDTDETRVGTLGGWHTHLDILHEVLSGNAHKGGFWTIHDKLEDDYRKRI